MPICFFSVRNGKLAGVCGEVRSFQTAPQRGRK